MASTLSAPMSDDPDFVAEIARLEQELGPLSAEMIETRWRLRLQAGRCAAGDHAYTWSGQILDLPGGSPHQVMACAYAAVHDDDTPSPRLIGPLHTSENAAKRLWSEQELKEHAPPR
jgi:hypothetical protein